MDIRKNEFIEESRIIPKKAEEERWYAIYTKPHAEKQVYQRLQAAGIESFFPLQKTYRVWSDRKKLIDKPLLPSYLFVKTKSKNYHHTYQIPGVVRFISFEGKPVAIPQKQIDNLKLLVNSDADIEITSENFANGDKVEVITGSLIGLTGELIRIGSKSRVVIRIDKLDQNLLVRIPKAFLKRVG